ncbi:MAG: hypothetical protein JRN20_01370 [Nitrososphaerota archaeon]|nr:hypothetical protein [Nitrososphaerota archaeon]
MHVSVKEYANRSLDDRWLYILDDLDKSLADRVRLCRKKFSYWECENRHKFLAGSLCRKDSVCPVCARAMLTELAEDGFDILNRIACRMGGKVRVWAGVHTAAEGSEAGKGFGLA